LTAVKLEVEGGEENGFNGVQFNYLETRQGEVVLSIQGGETRDKEMIEKQTPQALGDSNH
jgi:hypothetical protein